ncbi:hypothetical protein TH66_09560 [Carbonactinospora thermoautotrophica]|uniref:Peptidase M48 domain-containing protein n=2 Tax=Carbonactinospora thermoautotrophica TaxID=1469144 RepID=A0A132N2I2_9ACTN|nr:M56 family metallopeptidase [Carbonactinospora thermoautotrophica]KWX04140.1 hypothetical protein TH66_09560 [Carbonactinospora thermoautotrophica]
MPAFALLTALTLACALLAHRLMRSRWAWYAPSSAIALWQGLGLAAGVSAIGAAFALAVSPYHLGVMGGFFALVADILAGEPLRRLGPGHLAALLVGVTLAGWLFSALAVASLDTARIRRRHSELLDLVAHQTPDVPGALVIDHPAAAAYCLPGVRSRLVVSTGALRMLSPDELRAVLAHERAHACERHDLVLLPFAALCRAFPRLRLCQEANATVALLVEMRADDRAREQHPPQRLAQALLRFGQSLIPAGALGAADLAVLLRVARLTGVPRQVPRRVRATAVAAAAGLGTLPLLLMACPWLT